MRWERVGRIGLLVVLGIVVALYVEHTMSYFHTRTQAEQQQGQLEAVGDRLPGLGRSGVG